MQELLVLVVVGLAIFFLPRMMGRRKAPSPDPAPLSRSLTGRMRLSILVTFLWIASWAAFLKPWERDPLTFAYLALGPTVVLWGAFWVWLGYRKYRR